jgi:hypothetical protein
MGGGQVEQGGFTSGRRRVEKPIREPELVREEVMLQRNIDTQSGCSRHYFPEQGIAAALQKNHD